MAQMTVAESTPLTAKEIKEFAGATGPCVTLLLPVDVPGKSKRGLAQRLKAAAAEAERKLQKHNVVSTLVAKIVKPIVQLSATVEDESRGATLAVFSSEEGIRHFWLVKSFEEAAVAGSNFYIRPFLKDLEGVRPFFILALDQKNVRLLRCTESTSEEIDLGDRIPHSLQEHTAADQPDHVLDNRAAGGPSSGPGSQGVMFTTGTDREKRDEHLLHFYKDVNRGLSEVLKGQEKTPLVVCGVEYELVLFRQVNTWENTCPEGVRGAPNSLKGGEMHARALDCVARLYDLEIESLLAQHDKQGGEAATAGVNDLVKAAYEGRVMHLFVAENAQAMGNFDEASHRARTHQVARDGDEDLINAAAIQTILHAGRVHVLPQGRIPGNRPMAAVMRY